MKRKKGVRKAMPADHEEKNAVNGEMKEGANATKYATSSLVPTCANTRSALRVLKSAYEIFRCPAGRPEKAV